MSSQAVTVYFCLGSNMGNRQGNLDRALEILAQRMPLGKVSSVYDSEFVGDPDQPRCLNLVCEASTRLTPEGVLLITQGAERKLGRPAQHTPNAPRSIDIDILFYGNEIVEKPDLVIPHPRIAERAFVLVPLDEIASGLVHPLTGKTVKEMLAAVTETQGVLKWDKG
jgi:2-amino-4-hydroxy-6-hydroxymethyldihydropteridine diphosphokinase